jgi:hypothetical protein
MKYFFFASLFTLFLSGEPVAASEVTQCFEKAWAHPENGGLGLQRGSAIELCKKSS